MRLIMTDNSKLWNIDDPFWEQFKDIIIVVCLNGKSVTDKYECFISPFNKKKSMKYGIGDSKLDALASVTEKLNSRLGYHDDIVFLTDNDPRSFYPFYVLKDLIEYNRIHMITVSPWRFDSNARSAAYYQMISDLSALNSLLYYDSNRALKSLGQPTTIGKAYSYVKKELEGIMIGVLNEIYENRYNGYRFFDFSSMSYVPVKEGFDEINANHAIQDDEIKFPLYRNLCTLGLVCPPSYPEKNEHTKKEIERPIARIDGKKVCNTLREQRILLAEANKITFESEECPTIGPCAGTCDKCDREAKYLYDQMKKIPKEERVYPQFDAEMYSSDKSLDPENKSDYLMGDVFQPWMYGEGEK